MSQRTISGKQFGSDVFFHGTDPARAASILKEGFTPSSAGAMGAGVYVTPKISKANSYASGAMGGVTKRSGSRRVGTVLAVRAQGKPLMNGDSWDERTYRPEQLTVVHKQNVNASSTERASDREAGFPPHPDTGPEPFVPTPVSQLPKAEVRKRIAARRADPFRDAEGLLVM
jgi:hypothetical protein